MLARLFICIVIAAAFAHTAFAQQQQQDVEARLRNAASDSEKLQVYKTVPYYGEMPGPMIIKHLLKGTADFKARGYTKGEAELLVILAGMLGTQGDINAARAHAARALELYTSLGDKRGLASINNTIGVLEGRSGDLPQAIKRFLTALKLFEERNDTSGIISTYVKLGAANEMGNNLDKALGYYRTAIGLAEAKNDTANCIYIINNIGAVFCRRGQFDSAIVYFEQALALSKYAYTKLRILPLTNLGTIYRDKGENNRALKHYAEAVEIARKHELKEDYARLLLNMASLEPAQKADASMKEAWQLAKEAGSKALETEVLSGLADNAIRLNNYKNAVSYMKLERRINDSLFNVEKAREIAGLQSEYELQKSNNKVAKLQAAQQLSAQRTRFIIIIVVLLAVLLATSVLLLSRSSKLNRRLKSREKELERANATKDRVFSVIGHDLRGPIGSIPTLIEICRSEDTDETERNMIMDAMQEHAVASYQTLETLLLWGGSQIKGITLHQQTLQLHDVVSNKLRLFIFSNTKKKLAVKNNVPANMTAFADENHVKFALRNLISNAVKFSSAGGTIELDCIRRDNMVVLSVRDTGVGIAPEKHNLIFEPFNVSAAGTENEQGTSIGLMLSRDFIRQNGGDIWVESTPGHGACFFVSLKASDTV